MSKTNFTRKYKESKHLTLAILIILSNQIKEAAKCNKKKLPFMSKRTMAKILGVSPQTVLKVQLKLNKRLIIKLSIKMNIVQYMVNMCMKQIE